MNEKKISILSASVTLIIGLICIFRWFSHDPTAGFVMNVPGMDNQPTAEEKKAKADKIMIGEFFEAFDGTPSDLPGEWIQFRGDISDNISKENVPLANKWGENGPEILWTVELGEGHAAPAVKNGRVYILDYDEEKKGDALRCFSLADGREIWRRWYRINIKRNHGISRTVPVVTDKYVVTLGPKCHVMCVDAITGDYIWGIDMERDYGTETPFWYTGQCPLLDDSTVVLAPSGTVMMMGVDLATGNTVWQTPNPHGWKMSHVAIMPMTLNGKKMFVYSAIEGVVGVSAEEEDKGSILWETTLWSHSVLAPSPVVADDGKIFLTAGYGAGSMVLQIKEENGSYTVTKLQEFKPKEGLASEQQTPLLYKGHLFGILPKDAGMLRNQFVCYKPEDCTKLIWSSGKSNRFGLGPYLLADGKIFILNDDGVLTMIEAGEKEYKQLDQAQILDGHDAWGPLAIVGGRLLLRDSKTMVCLDMRAK